MRSVLRNEGPAKNVAMNPKAAALVGLILVLPFAVIEAVNNTITGRSAPGLIVLFGLLWLLAAAFIVILVPLVRAVRAGGGVAANPFHLLFRVALLALIVMTWAGIVVDQMPCFMGVPNCD